MTYDVLIVIVNFNTKDLLRRCLESILATTKTLYLRIIVVDNASGDGSGEMVKKEFPEAILIENKENIGFAGAVNQGVRSLKAEFTLLLNPDVEVKEGAIERMYRFIKERKEAGIIGCRLTYPDGAYQPSCRRFPNLIVSIFDIFPINLWFPENRWIREYNYNYEEFKNPVEVEWVSGAVLMMRYDIFEELGGFDEGYFIYSEEMDFCKRLRDKGYKVYYLPNAEIIHHRGASTKETSVRQVDYYKSLYRFFRKYYGLKKSLPLRIAILIWSILYTGFLLLKYIIFKREKDRNRAEAQSSLLLWSIGAG